MQNDKQLILLLNSYLVQSGALAKQTLADILNLDDALMRIYSLVYTQNGRAALKALADIAKKKQGKEIFAALVRRDADKLISIGDDKARKTAYKLIGICAPNECADMLLNALKSEKTRFARPSIILALGNTHNPKRYLADYVIEPGESKHEEQERQALKKALGKAAKTSKAFSVKFPQYCLLNFLQFDALKSELEAKKCEYDFKYGMFKVRTEQSADLRCYHERLFPLGKDYAQIAKMLDGMGLSSKTFRVEAGGIRKDKRREAIYGISKGLERFGYIDNPSAYDFEIRLANSYAYAKFSDERFSYRKRSVAAGINPVAAASIMRLCKKYMRAGAHVLDPFCGSGTMLIERSFILPAASLTGIDISPQAIKAALENRKASGVDFAIIQKDCLKFKSGQFDEVIANMPFGLRVSNHNKNKKLYYDFANKLPELLGKAAHAFLFTQEKTLLLEALSLSKKLILQSEHIFHTGGLYPSLFIIKKV